MFSKKRPATAEDELLQRSVTRARITHTEMHSLRNVFQKKDRDKSGSLDMDEFYNLFGAQKSPFGDALFRLVDVGGDGDFLSFSEFVEIVTTYCLFGPKDILRFAFSVVDEDGSGFVSLSELDKLASFLHKAGPSNLNTALARIQAKWDKGDGEFSYETFLEIHREFPFLLHPAFQLQEFMMDAVWGRKVWLRKKKELGLVKEDNGDPGGMQPAFGFSRLFHMAFPSLITLKRVKEKDESTRGADGGDAFSGSAMDALPPPGPELLSHKMFCEQVQSESTRLEVERGERKRKAAAVKNERKAEELRLLRERRRTRRQRALTTLADATTPMQLAHQPRPVESIF